MNTAEWCIKNRTTFSSLLIAVAVIGLTTFATISKLEDPEFVIRTAMVLTSFPGAAPQKVEELVTDKLEVKIRELAELDYLESQSIAGMSIIEVNFLDKYPPGQMRSIFQRLRNKVSDARLDLPKEAGLPFVNDDFGDVYGVVIALTGDGFSYREMKDVAEEVRDELRKIESVGKVELYGLQEERVYIEFSNARLAEVGANPYILSQYLAMQNSIRPSGDAKVGPDRVIIEATGEFNSVEELENTSLRIPGRPEGISLKDIAEVKRGFVDPSSPMTRFNDQKSIILAINMRSGHNIIKMGEAVQFRVAEIQKTLPVGLEFETLIYAPTYVTRSVKDLSSNLIQAILFVLVGVIAFAGIRMGLVCGTLIPMAMLAGIAVMPHFDIQIHSISIAALIISLGILIDNGVVMTENILVRLSQGEERLAACTGSVKELAIPLLAGSLTTIIAFSPLGFALGSASEFVGSLFSVVTITLVVSWIFSLTMMPMLSYFFLKPKKQKGSGEEGKLYQVYRKMLFWCLANRKSFLIGLGIVLSISLWGFRFVPSLFFPPNDREVVLVDFWLPFGTDIGTTSEEASLVEKWLLENPDVTSVGTFVGNGGPRWYLALAPEQAFNNYAFLIVNLRDAEQVKPMIHKIEAYIEDRFPDSRPRAFRLEMGPPIGYPLQIRISGNEIETIYELREKIEGAMSSVSGMVNIHDDWGEWSKKMVIDVNQEKAKRAGLTSEDIALSLQTQYSGLVSTDFREGDEMIPIVLRSRENIRENLSQIETLNVYSYQSRQSLPLLQVADAKITWEPSNIRRRDQNRTMTVRAEAEGRYASEVLSELRPKIQKLTDSPDWPAGYSIAYGGEIEESTKAQKKLFAPFPFAMLVMVFILIAQFNSLLRPLIVVLTIPPMMIGVTPGLLLTGSTFGFMALLGLMSMIGLVAAIAIMMIDRIEIERSGGKPVLEAVISAAQQRLRPILMTATVSVIGLVPLLFAGGEFWRPMTIVLVSGQALATIFTLAMCPVLYTLFFGVKQEEIDRSLR